MPLNEMIIDLKREKREREGEGNVASLLPCRFEIKIKSHLVYPSRGKREKENMEGLEGE